MYIFSLTLLIETEDMKRSKQYKFSDYQLRVLDEVFCKQTYISLKDCHNVCRQLNINENEVGIWFRNKRVKSKYNFAQNGVNIPQDNFKIPRYDLKPNIPELPKEGRIPNIPELPRGGRLPHNVELPRKDRLSYNTELPRLSRIPDSYMMPKRRRFNTNNSSN